MARLFDELHELATGFSNEVLQREYDSIVNNAREVAKKGGLFITRSSLSAPLIERLRNEDNLRIEHIDCSQHDQSPSYYKILWDRPHWEDKSTSNYGL